VVEPGRLVDRVAELSRLKTLWESGQPGLAVVYGRRRVGKTRLILEWLRGRRHAYYQAGLWPGNLRALAEAVAEQLGLEALRGAEPRSLRGLFELLSALLGGERAAVVIDEFTYWLRVEPGVVSELQYVVDHVLPGTRLLVVISGSTVGLMQREVLGGGAPLYGRAVLRRKLGELEPWCLPPFAPRYGPRELVEAYSLFGGIPFYLRLLDDQAGPLDEFIRLFGPEGVLEDEPLFLMREEFREPSPYLALLRAIARGARGLGEAAQSAGLPTSHASRYLHSLIDLGLVEREPILFRRRGSLYRVADNMLAAWLSIVEPLLPLLRENPGAAMARASALARTHYARVWEKLACRHAVAELAPRHGIAPVEAGRLVHRGEEIDCLIIDHGSGALLAVEAKWSTLDRGEAEAVARKLSDKLARALPARLRGYRRVLAVYAAEAKGGAPPGVELVEAADLPWGRGCR